MYTPPKATENTQARKTVARVFLLLLFTAAVAGSLGFVNGQRTDMQATALGSSDQNAWTSSLESNPRIVKTTTESGESVCLPRSEDKKCLDKCSTTYINSISQSGGTIVKACVFTNKSKDKVAIAIQNVVNKCQGKDFDGVWKEAKCYADPNEGIDALSKTAEGTGYVMPVPKPVISVPLPPGKSTEECKKAYKELAEVIKKSLNVSETKATKTDASSCEFKGAVQCFQDSKSMLDLKGGKYKCKPKRDSSMAPGGDAEFCKKNPRLCTSGKPDPNKIYNRGISDGLNASGRSGIEQGSGWKMPKMPQGKGGGTGQPRQQCPQGTAPQQQSQATQQAQINDEDGFFSGFISGLFGGGKQHTTAGGIKCVPISCPSGQVVQGTTCVDKPLVDSACLLLLNKTTVKKGENIQVKWNTSGTGSVRFTTDTGAIIGSVGSSGEKTITPQKSGYITMESSASKTSKACHETENIIITDSGGDGDGDGNDTEEGDYPPRVSCIPGNVEEGGDTKVVVNWSCSLGEPSSSTGVNFNTDGELTGTADVHPAHSTRYDVSCEKDGTVIGKNSCVVLVENPLFDIIVWPIFAGVGERVRVSWGSLGMTSCKVQGPGNFLYNQPNGVVITTPFPENSNESEAIYTIECASKFGKTTTRDVVVDLY